MHRQLLNSDTIYDICIIGGGATGAGCALDAQSRGLKTILIEKNDFASGTSSKSTKLIHGGVRYLEQAVKKLSIGQFKMVIKALKERQTLLTIAPHITKPLQLLTPCRSFIEGLYYFIGLKLYDLLSGKTNIGGSEFYKKRKALERIPTLNKKNLYNAVLYYDGQLDDLRFNWALIQTAIEKGATCINHVQAIEFKKNNNGQLHKLKVKDKLTGTEFYIQAKQFINACGPFADAIRTMANPQLKPRIRASSGIHILLPKQMMPSDIALLIPQTKDGRLIFAIPYQKHLLVGTTDEAAEITDKDFGPSKDEVKYLLEYVNEYLDVQAKPADVLSGFGGLRPLIMKDSSNTKDLIRDHEVEFDTTSNLISILGGKWTTYRLMAKDTIDAACNNMNLKNACITNKIILAGSNNFNHNVAIQLQQKTNWDYEIVKHLTSKYGYYSLKIIPIISNNPLLKERLLPGLPYTYAELEYVLLNEMAFTVKDVLCNRWGTQLANWQQTIDLIPIVGNLMSKHFNWNPSEEQKYIHDYKVEIEMMMVIS